MPDQRGSRPGGSRNRRRPNRSGAPLPFVALALVGASLFAVPIAGLLSRTPWSDLVVLWREPIVVEALWLSLITSIVATGLSLVLGIPLAYVLGRCEFWGRSLVRSVVLLPMVLPPVVGGAALLFAFGRRGVFGAPLFDLTGFSLPFTIWGVIIANTFVAMPFLIITVEGALGGVDSSQIHAAETLGASQWLIARRVVLPAVSGSLRGGAVLAWARALGEFGATVTFAGNLQGRTQTLPLAVFVALESDRDAAVAISLILILIAITVMTILRSRSWGPS